MPAADAAEAVYHGPARRGAPLRVVKASRARRATASRLAGLDNRAAAVIAGKRRDEERPESRPAPGGSNKERERAREAGNRGAHGGP
jgi:hypothetical protein